MARQVFCHGGRFSQTLNYVVTAQRALPLRTPSFHRPRGGQWRKRSSICRLLEFSAERSWWEVRGNLCLKPGRGSREGWTDRSSVHCENPGCGLSESQPVLPRKMSQEASPRPPNLRRGGTGYSERASSSLRWSSASPLEKIQHCIILEAARRGLVSVSDPHPHLPLPQRIPPLKSQVHSVDSQGRVTTVHRREGERPGTVLAVLSRARSGHPFWPLHSAVGRREGAGLLAEGDPWPCVTFLPNPLETLLAPFHLLHNHPLLISPATADLCL